MTEQELEKREKVLRMAIERMLPEFVKSCTETRRPAPHPSRCIRLRITMSTNFSEWRSSLRDCMGKNFTSSGKIGKRLRAATAN